MTKAPFSWPDWWPNMRGLKLKTHKGSLQGTKFSCEWLAPIGYRLHTDVKITEVMPLKIVRLETFGDLHGTVVCRISGKNTTHVAIEWQVATTKPWMIALQPLLKPFFIWSHHAVMRNGERGLQEYIAARIKNPGRLARDDNPTL
jgi:hypothetical protein